MSLFDHGYMKKNKHAEIKIDDNDARSGYEHVEEKFSKRLNRINGLDISLDKAINDLNKPITVTMEEVEQTISSIYKMADDAAADDMLKPVFIGAINGAMRACKVTAKTGLTAERIYAECESFSYEKENLLSTYSDSFTEAMAERFVRDDYAEANPIITKEMRDKGKMDKYKEDHFNGSVTAKNEYSPDEQIYINNKEGHSAEGNLETAGRTRHEKSAETDHIVPCATLCNDLKSNKALTTQDIKDIINDNANFAVTSHEINNDKRDCSNPEYIEKRKDDLSENTKETMLKKNEEARSVLDKKQNDTVIDNLKNNRDIQTTFATDAGKAAACQLGGNLILHVFKPIYFEMKDSISNGIEEGVSAADFKEALKLRFVTVQTAASSINFLI
ncbi:hypothetical protein [Maridesulfovibrio ferrireducens]|uniref:hypothetical protein n=1 Tax=Maridesulfovibrio ferrireducens TaxID=246191 RepID=UPI001A26B6B9|nr:hypothetical protein [Maridesulfovibrio ferrireducens]MBI9113370.1 hypothetical protein [Maridesulfovibrio ferrireducens]